MPNPLATALRKLASLVSKRDDGLDAFLGDVRGVIHVGANAGQERDLYDRYDLDVIWIEPIPDVFAELERNIAGYPRQCAFRRIFTDRAGQEIKLKIANNNGAASSILEIGDLTEIWPEIEYTGVLRMQSSTLGDFLREEAIQPEQFDALVMDTQGSELLVLKGGGDALSQFRYIKTEAADFDAYRGCCTIGDLGGYLSGHGFHEVARHTFAEGPSGGCYYDVLYSR